MTAHRWVGGDMLRLEVRGIQSESLERRDAAFGSRDRFTQLTVRDDKVLPCFSYSSVSSVTLCEPAFTAFEGVR